MNSAEIHKAVTEAINNETIISDECARAIAYNWMAPETCMSAFAHGFQVRVIQFWTEIYRELQDQSEGPKWDLMALLDYVESAEMNREMRANREDEQ